MSFTCSFSVDSQHARIYTCAVSRHSQSVTLKSYAKINLTLDVIAPRPDGFHDIETVMQTISLHDTVSVRVSEQKGIRLTCDSPNIPTDDRNLAYRAAVLMLCKMQIDVGLDIHIEKRIPIEAGLGGGSSNAAAVVRGLLKANPRVIPNWDPKDLTRFAASIGSDVPFFLFGGTAFVKGRGEEVEKLPDIDERPVVLVKPRFGISTGWAYRRLDEMGHTVSKRETFSQRMRKCILEEGCLHLPLLLSNDLELPAIERHPQIGEIKKALIAAGALGSLMCGSGSAVFGLFESEESAKLAVPTLESFGKVFLTRTVRSGDE